MAQPKLLVVDRDGVINKDSPDYIRTPDEWIPLPGSLEAIAALNRAEYEVVVATNQSGVGRGLFTAEVLAAIHRKIELAQGNGFYTQFDRMRQWADERHDKSVTATLLCGDFNIKAGSDAYCHIVRSSEYEDQYLKTVNRPAFDRVYRDGVEDIGSAIGHDGRIDYIFLKRGSRVHSLNGRELFTSQSYGRVSDHTGYYVEFELL